MPEKDKESEEGRSIFNMGLATLQRIDIAMRNANTFRLMGDCLSLKESINNIFQETYPFLKSTERTNQSKIKKKVDAATLNYQSYLNIKSEDKTFSKAIMISPETFMQILEEWELRLRVLLKEHNLLMPSTEDPRFAMKY